MTGKMAVHNPLNKPLDELPTIYGFVNGGETGLLDCALMAEDGTYLGGHGCSAEFYAPSDLGCVEGSQPLRHEGFREKYPDGYRMEYVPTSVVKTHAGLDAACRLNLAAGAAARAEDEHGG